MSTSSARHLFAVIVAAVVLVAPGCGGDGGTTASTTSASPTTSEPVIDPGDGGHYAPELDPTTFVATIDHPHLPLIPGSRWVYEGTDDGEDERIVVEVLEETRLIEGIAATVVRDTVSVDGEVVEDTYDWYAQDEDGNVWYLGEDTHEYEDGKAVNAEGAWEYGVDGALPGIVMPAAPEPGDAYRQEYAIGVAEDMAEVLEVGVSEEIGIGPFDDVVVTEDWNPLEPDVVEEKWYAAGVGLIREATTAGGDGTVELVEVTPRP